jgi:RimJ/RimL family protein N-acetyltransferase
MILDRVASRLIARSVHLLERITASDGYDHATEVSVIFGDQIAIGPILPVDITRLFQWSDDVEELRCNESYRPLNWYRQEAFWLNAENDLSRCFFAIRGRSSADIIGFIQISRIDPIHRSALIGVHIGDRDQRSQGKGSEALRMAIDYCWNHLNLTRLTLSAFAENARAIALYERIGFRREGHFRDALFISGRWIDVIAMALHHPDRTTPRRPAAEAAQPESADEVCAPALT